MAAPSTTLPALLSLLLLPSLAMAQKDLPLEARVFKGKDGKTLPYRLLTPPKVEPGKTYPLVLFLHGAGERGTDNTKQMVHGVPQFAAAKTRAQYPCFLVAPQCPNGKRWVEVDWSAASHKQPKEPSAPMALTLELLDNLVKHLPIDQQRLYVTGLSMGGYGTWDILARRPKMFAAGVPICGGGDEAQAKVLADIPLWAFHGAKDTVVRPERSRNMIAAIKKAGGEPRYTEYPAEAHASWNPAYRDPEMVRWLFDQKRK